MHKHDLLFKARNVPRWGRRPPAWLAAPCPQVQGHSNRPEREALCVSNVCVRDTQDSSAGSLCPACSHLRSARIWGGFVNECRRAHFLERWFPVKGRALKQEGERAKERERARYSSIGSFCKRLPQPGLGRADARKSARGSDADAGVCVPEAASTWSQVQQREAGWEAERG